MPVTTVIPLLSTPLADDRASATFAVDAGRNMRELNPAFAAWNTGAGQMNSTAAEATSSAAISTGQAAIATTQATTATTQAAAAAASAASAINAPGTSATSTTTATLAANTSLGLTVQAGKTLAVGQPVFVAATAALGNFGQGQISSYNSGSGELVVQVASIQGVSAAYSAWSVTAAAQDPIAGMLGQLPLLEPTFVMEFWRGRVPSAINAVGGACRLIAANGQFRDAAANSAEVDWSAASARCRGLLVESERTFAALWSSNLSTATWVKTAVVVTASTLSLIHI
jgi:hypothetical protein